MRPEPVDIVTRLRMYAEDLHSAGGFNGYASAMSLAADEIVKLREYAEMMDKDMIATIKQRDELGADKTRWMRMAEVFAKQAAEKDKQIEFLKYSHDAIRKLAYETGAQEEREACARIVESEACAYSEPVWAVEIVNDIRARGLMPKAVRVALPTICVGRSEKDRC